MTTAPYPSYPSLDQFYDWRGGRHSGESDYGEFNWDDAIKPAPGESQAQRGRLRVALVHDTGDLYAVDNGGQGPVLLLGTFQQHRSREQVEQRLADWTERDGPGRPRSWFHERIASLASRPGAGAERGSSCRGRWAGLLPLRAGAGRRRPMLQHRLRPGQEETGFRAQERPGPLGRLPDPAGLCRSGRLPRRPTPPWGARRLRQLGYLDGPLTWPPGLVHWAPEDHRSSREGPCRCLACRVIEELRRDA